MSTQAYNDIPALRWSLLKSILVSERNFLQTEAKPVAPSGPMRLGTATHCALLTPDVFAKVPDRDHLFTDGGDLSKSKAAIEEIKALESVDPDVVIVSSAQRAMILRLVAYAYEDDDISTWLSESPLSSREQRAVWTERVIVDGAVAGTPSRFPWAVIGDGYVDVTCKGNWDWHSPRLNLLGDVKTDGQPGFSVRRCGGRIWADGQAAQLGFYERGMLATGEIDCPQSLAFIYLKTKDGFEDVIAYELDDDAAQAARDEAEEALVKVATAIAFDRWPGVAPKKVSLAIPAWRNQNTTDAADLGLDFGGENGE